MILVIFTVFLVAFFSPESLVSTIVGGAVTLGATHFLKNITGLQGGAAAILAFVVSLVIAAAAYVVSTMLAGDSISWQMIPQAGTQIFALATIAYKLLMADAATTPTAFYGKN